MDEYTPTTGDVRAAYNQLITATRPHELPHDYPCPEFDRWLAEHDEEVVLDERDRVSNILSDRSKFWLNESKREDISLKQREHCEDRAEILSNAIALIVWNNEGINNV